MKIIIYGANGKVGSLVVRKMLDAGHQVVAFVHGRVPFSTDKNLEIIQGDIYDSEAVAQAMQGCNIVVSTLGSWGTPKKDILSRGMMNIIPAMKSHRINRIVSLTGQDARWSKDRNTWPHWLTHAVLQFGAPKILKDGELHLELLEKSGLDWTVLRSPIMNEKGSSAYRLTKKRPMPWRTIHRHAVARAILDECFTRPHAKVSPFLVRK